MSYKHSKFSNHWIIELTPASFDLFGSLDNIVLLNFTKFSFEFQFRFECLLPAHPYNTMQNQYRIHFRKRGNHSKSYEQYGIDKVKSPLNISLLASSADIMNIWDLDQTRQYVRPDLDPNCLTLCIS